MLEVPVFDVAGKKLGAEKVDPLWFGGIVRRRLIHDATIIYQNNQRAGTHKVKERGEVAGSKKKPWKQKHTGRARVGTKRSPIWRHGGIVFGPHPRDYSASLPKQMKRAALDSALLSKFQDGEAVLVDSLKLEKPKTSTVAGALEAMGIKESCLISIEQADAAGRNVYLSARNLQRVHSLPVADLNALDVLRYKRLLLTKDAFTALVKNRRDGVDLPVPKSKQPAAIEYTHPNRKERGKPAELAKAEKDARLKALAAKAAKAAAAKAARPKKAKVVAPAPEAKGEAKPQAAPAPKGDPKPKGEPKPPREKT
ncbi:MAG: 50S ribosomal protein L4 [Planctomycetota bacterium]